MVIPYTCIFRTLSATLTLNKVNKHRAFAQRMEEHQNKENESESNKKRGKMMEIDKVWMKCKTIRR